MFLVVFLYSSVLSTIMFLFEPTSFLTVPSFQFLTRNLTNRSIVKLDVAKSSKYSLILSNMVARLIMKKLRFRYPRYGQNKLFIAS